MTPLNSKFQSALSSLPKELSESIEREYVELEYRFARGDWGPSEMNGGRLAETIVRYIEYKNIGSYTQFGTQINRSVILSQAKNNVNLPESIRFHIPNCAVILMDVRNKRDVAHLGNDIDVHEMDSVLMFRVASWVLSEILRLESGISSNEIQKQIDSLSQKKIPLVEEIAGDIFVVGTHLKAIKRALVVLYQNYPDPFNIKLLQKAIQYKNSSRFEALLEEKQTHGLVYVKNEKVYLTRKGTCWVEDNIDLVLEFS
jgi:hypothetical protein